MRTSPIIFLTILIFFCCQNSNESASDERLEAYENDSSEINRIPPPTDEFSEEPDDPERRIWQNPSLVINKLGNLKGKIVADIGAGTGYFSFRLASAGARVIAIDIDEEFLEYIEKRQDESLSAPGLYAVNTRLSEENDPLLKENEADAVLIVNTYTYLTNRVSYLQKVLAGMVPGGQLVIVDYKNAANPVMNSTAEILEPEIVAKELEQAGFSDVVIDRNSLQYQYILTAKK